MLQVYQYPEPKDWPALCRRPDSDTARASEVRLILQAVKEGGDTALQALTQQFDGVTPTSIAVQVSDIDRSIDPDLAKAIELARRNIETFHKTQLREEVPVETQPGVTCWRRAVPVEKVGLYVPGGTAPLFSTLLMLGVPARLAGCREVVVCTPPQRNGTLHPVIAHTASVLGIRQVYLAGGAQAIAAMAYGTSTIPRVDKIFGPGNSFVTMAKLLVQQEGVAIDMPAGPSEVLVIAEAQSQPSFIAADLLSQAEHGPDSQVILISDSTPLVERVQVEIDKQLSTLPRADIARQALTHSKAIIVRDLDEGIAFSNAYAPEHLIINTVRPEVLSRGVANAGSVFLGPYSCESAGDYCSGTNHTLPTNGFARCYSGVSVESFMKKVTFQTISKNGLQGIGPAIVRMAQAEQLDAHAHAVTIRLKEEEHV